MDKSILFIFSGLPGTGKSTLAKATGATYLRIDPAEQAIRDLCDYEL
jgi:predicted kinase